MTKGAEQGGYTRRNLDKEPLTPGERDLLRQVLKDDHEGDGEFDDAPVVSMHHAAPKIEQDPVALDNAWEGARDNPDYFDGEVRGSQGPFTSYADTLRFKLPKEVIRPTQRE
jgi:hypothetical protein